MGDESTPLQSTRFGTYALSVPLVHPLFYDALLSFLNSKAENGTNASFSVDNRAFRLGESVVCPSELHGIARRRASAWRGAPGVEYRDPDDFFVQQLVILPPRLRPRVSKPDGSFEESPITRRYAALIDKDQKCRRAMEDGGELASLRELEVSMQRALCDLLIPRDAAAADEDHSIVGALSQKQGLLRNAIAGKRNDHCARSVLTPNDSLRASQVGVPRSLAEQLTVPVDVTADNVEKLQNELFSSVFSTAGRCNPPRYFLQDSRSSEEFAIRPTSVPLLHPGMVVHRPLTDGDVVMLNRSPSLHVGSALGHVVVLVDEDTIQINTCVAPSYAADYDGDEVNIHVPQTPAAVHDLRNCLSVASNVLHRGTGGCAIRLVHGAVMALTMSCKDGGGAEHPISAAFREIDVPLTYGLFGVSIVDGVYRGGVITDAIMHDRHGIVPAVVQQYGGACALALLERLQASMHHRLANNNVSLRRDDFDVDESGAPRAGTALAAMLESGSRGSMAHVRQVAVELGQQEALGAPVLDPALHRLPHAPLDPAARANDPLSRGFVAGNYRDGMTTAEHFVHMMAARAGVIESSCFTSVSGNLQRCLVAGTRDIRVCDKGISLDAGGRVVSFRCGGDGYDGRRTRCSVNVLSQIDASLTLLNQATVGLECEGFVKKLQMDHVFMALNNVEVPFDSWEVFSAAGCPTPPPALGSISSLSGAALRALASNAIADASSNLVMPDSRFFDSIRWRSMSAHVLSYARIILWQGVLMFGEKFDLKRAVSFMTEAHGMALVDEGSRQMEVAALAIGEAATQLNLNSFRRAGAEGGSPGLGALESLLMARPTNDEMRHELLLTHPPPFDVRALVSAPLKSYVCGVERSHSSSADPPPERDAEESCGARNWLTTSLVEGGAKLPPKPSNRRAPWYAFDVRYDLTAECSATACCDAVRRADAEAGLEHVRFGAASVSGEGVAVTFSLQASKCPDAAVRGQCAEALLARVLVGGVAGVEAAEVVPSGVDSLANTVRVRGGRLTDVMAALPGCAVEMTTDVRGAEQALGVEAATSVIRNGLANTVPAVMSRHCYNIADSLTHTGSVRPFTRHAFARESGFLKRMCFENLREAMTTTALNGAVDHLLDTSARNMMGLLSGEAQTPCCAPLHTFRQMIHEYSEARELQPAQEPGLETVFECDPDALMTQLDASVFDYSDVVYGVPSAPPERAPAAPTIAPLLVTSETMSGIMQTALGESLHDCDMLGPLSCPSSASDADHFHNFLTALHDD